MGVTTKLAELRTKAGRKRAKPPKYLTIGIITALMGLNIEIIARASSCDLVGHRVSSHEHVSTASLAGWTSLWMWPIYGLVGVVLGKLNERVHFARLRMIYQCLIAVSFILALE